MRLAFLLVRSPYVYGISHNTYEYMQHFVHEMKTTLLFYFLCHCYERDFVFFTHVESDAKNTSTDNIRATHHSP